MIRIAIADDHALFRKGLSSLMNGWEDVELCIEASDGAELLQKIAQLPIDIVLLDLQMPVMSGLETCEILRKLYPDLKILILTFLVSTSEILKAVKSGADGYFTKNSNPLELLKAIKNIHGGGFHFEKSLSGLVKDIKAGEYVSGWSQSKIEISFREVEIIKLYAEEYNGKQIADMLNISLRTVESHKKNLMEKTNSKNFIGVIIRALENNLITLNELKS